MPDAEVLQEEVMEYVNTIAHIVHRSVAMHGGAANKNIGDAFLLVWKLPRGLTVRDVNNIVAEAKEDRRGAAGPRKSMEGQMGIESGLDVLVSSTATYADLLYNVCHCNKQYPGVKSFCRQGLSFTMQMLLLLQELQEDQPKQGTVARPRSAWQKPLPEGLTVIEPSLARASPPHTVVHVSVRSQSAPVKIRDVSGILIFHAARLFYC